MVRLGWQLRQFLSAISATHVGRIETATAVFCSHWHRPVSTRLQLGTSCSGTSIAKPAVPGIQRLCNRFVPSDKFTQLTSFNTLTRAQPVVQLAFVPTGLYDLDFIPHAAHPVVGSTLSLLARYGRSRLFGA